MVMLANEYAGQDPTGWWMSEKLDGVRAIWRDGKLWTRNDKEIFAPAWFVEQFPGSPLDGELWIGRGMFQRTVSVVRKKTPIADEWGLVQYRVFDVPVPEYTAEDRILIYSNLTVGRKYISLVPQTLCTGRANLDEFFKDVTSAGGEGVMLRAPGSLYENKRSKNLLKYKPVDDDEATVMGYKPGAGKYEGMTGTLVCVWHDVLIDIGTGLTDEDRKNPPPIGTVITFTYHGLTDGGAPRFPSYKGVRE